MKDPVDHILRPRLPWRSDEGAITECGLNASKATTITRDGFGERLKHYGQQRTAMMTCWTCSETCRRYKAWDLDPRGAVEREIAWETRRSRDDNGAQLRDELLAIADLIEAHREEFDDLTKAIRQRREWVAQKAARANSNATKKASQ